MWKAVGDKCVTKEQATRGRRGEGWKGEEWDRRASHGTGGRMSDKISPPRPTTTP
jgi:hypothetical protein